MELHHPRLSAGIRSNGSRVTRRNWTQQARRNLLNLKKNSNSANTETTISFGNATFRNATAKNRYRLGEKHKMDEWSQSRQNTSRTHRPIPTYNYNHASAEEQQLSNARAYTGNITQPSTPAAPRLNTNAAQLYANYSARYEDPYNMRRKISTNSILNNYKQLRRNLLAKWNYEYA